MTRLGAGFDVSVISRGPAKLRVKVDLEVEQSPVEPAILGFGVEKEQGLVSQALPTKEAHMRQSMSSASSVA